MNNAALVSWASQIHNFSISLLSFFCTILILSLPFFPSFFNRLSLCSVQFSRSVISDSLWPHGLQHTRLACPSPTPGAYSNSCPLSQWCHPTISLCLVFIPSTDYFLCVYHSIWFSVLLSLELVLLLKWFSLYCHIPFYFFFSFNFTLIFWL